MNCLILAENCFQRSQPKAKPASMEEKRQAGNCYIRTPAGGRSARHREADRGGYGSRTRERHHPPRPQTRQYQSHTGRQGVKVLDFGLAKAFGGDETRGDLSESPTLPAATLEGTILCNNSGQYPRFAAALLAEGPDASSAGCDRRAYRD